MLLLCSPRELASMTIEKNPCDGAGIWLSLSALPAADSAAPAMVLDPLPAVSGGVVADPAPEVFDEIPPDVAQPTWSISPEEERDIIRATEPPLFAALAASLALLVTPRYRHRRRRRSATRTA